MAGAAPDLDRVAHARHWMLALTRWCDRQPTMIEHNGLCQVHRAEVLEIGGDWTAALAAAERAAERFDVGVLNQLAAGKARYRQGEIHGLRGELDAAESAFREASLRGHEPQPGQALLRLARGDTPGAAAVIRRALRETPQRLPPGPPAAGLRTRSRAFELDAARATYTELGAAPDARWVDEQRSPNQPDGLTAREVEVLRLLSAGSSNREIAIALVISEHTVARHVQNILAKIEAPSRTAASAYAHRHNLV